MKQSGLTDKRRRFVAEYCRDWNATAAAIRAGYAKSGARTEGSRLLDDPEVKGAIDARIEELSMTAGEVLVRLTQQARAEYARFIREDGSVDLRGLHEAGLAHLVKGTRLDTQGRLNVEFYDAQAALVQLAKARGLMVNKHEVKDTTPESADAVAARVLASLPGARFKADGDADNGEAGA